MPVPARSIDDSVLRPLGLAIAQLDDPAFVRVLLQSLALSAVCFVGLLTGMLWIVHQADAVPGWLAWVIGLAGTVGSLLLAFWLFLPVAAAIGAMFIETIARAVERRHYPLLAPGAAAPMAAQIWDAVALGGRILGLSLLGLVLGLLLPGIGLVLGWAIGAYAIGRGLFVAVAMRRMTRRDAE